MRLILREEVDHLGTRGDIINVSRGYARNYLLPKKIAMEVTDDNLRRIEKEKKIYEAKMAKLKVEAEAVASSMTALTLTFERKVHGAGEDLYGSVSAGDIAEALEAKGFTVEKRKVILTEPIKSLGDYAVSVKLHPEVVPSFTVKVEPDAESAAALAAAAEAAAKAEASAAEPMADDEVEAD